MSPKNRNQDAGKLGEYTEYRRRNSNAGSSGGNRTVSLDLHASAQCHEAAKRIAPHFC
jgi:hypothetical protein